ncbi:serpin family protein [Thalassobaculum salexigens]|uniref:serpin family protein n=1 Tax=Thalassobaculum salexigens TaxID=455360 RepID=UPI00248DA458|nr:serpin family protein [Thalassobaculum salexigens]
MNEIVFGSIASIGRASVVTAVVAASFLVAAGVMADTTSTPPAGGSGTEAKVESDAAPAAPASTASASDDAAKPNDTPVMIVPKKTRVVLDAPAPTLGLQTYSALLDAEEGNVVLSPVSVEVALALVGEAATPEWKVDIGEVIGHSYEALSGMDDRASAEKGKLTLANALWLPEGFSITPGYSTRLIADYSGRVATVDFSAPETLERVNGWVSEQTEGAIPAILDQLSGQTTMLLTNAFYFKGAWLRPFAEEDTSAQAFKGPDGETEVALMRRAGSYPYAVGEHGRVARMFYEDTDLSLLIYLPNENADPDAARTEAMAWLFTVDFSETMPSASGTIGLPRFSANGDMDLTDILSEIGLDEVIGNAGVIAEIKGPFAPTVSRIAQRSFLKVDEHGTTAAAATAVLGLRSVKTDTFEFIVDRPFHIALHHANVPTPLMVGFIADPN